MPLSRKAPSMSHVLFFWCHSSRHQVHRVLIFVFLFLYKKCPLCFLIKNDQLGLLDRHWFQVGIFFLKTPHLMSIWIRKQQTERCWEDCPIIPRPEALLLRALSVQEMDIPWEQNRWGSSKFPSIKINTQMYYMISNFTCHFNFDEKWSWWSLMWTGTMQDRSMMW